MAKRDPHWTLNSQDMYKARYMVRISGMRGHCGYFWCGWGSTLAIAARRAREARARSLRADREYARVAGKGGGCESIT